MIHIYYGENREAAEKSAKQLLGNNFEIIDAENLEKSDLPNLFMGVSLFSENGRKILLKGLAEKKELFDELDKYLDTPHEIIILEKKIDGKWTSFKDLKKNKKINIKEYSFTIDPKKRFLSFNIFDEALKNPKNALKILKENKETEDPFIMLGSWSSKAIKNLQNFPKNSKNHRIVKELARIDMLMKTSKYSENPWILLKSFILLLQTF